MNAKEQFERLGYVQTIHQFEDETYQSCNGIQYVKQDPESEMQRIGMVSTKSIEFYFMHKEVVISTHYKHRNGNESYSDSSVLSLEELKAVQKQMEELMWQ